MNVLSAIQSSVSDTVVLTHRKAMNFRYIQNLLIKKMWFFGHNFTGGSVDAQNVDDIHVES